MKKICVLILLVLVVSSNGCRRSHATNNATKFVTDLTTARQQVYDQVRLVKKSPLDDTKKKELKDQYEKARTLFNDAYTKIAEKLPQSPVDQLKCPIFGYQTLVHAQQANLELASEKGNEFLKSSSKALTPAGAGAGFVGIATFLADLFKELQKGSLAVCRQKVEDLKYSEWEDIK